ncbi:MAG: hypothetical protein HY059_06300 [Proteobacteria bacterium]|nr:hypothetical protein [Pseudomonadota bacterium]
MRRLLAGVLMVMASRAGAQADSARAARDSAWARTADSLRLVALRRLPAATRLSKVVITPGTFGLLAPARGVAETLGRAELIARPQLGEDLFRSIARLPGLSSGEIGAGFHVRCAEVDQLHVSLDGLELFEPFHMKDFDNALSILDVHSVEGIDLVTSGFTAEYGNRLGSVLAIRSRAPRTDSVRTTLAASVTNLRLQSQGGFAGGQGGWLVAARRGYLDLAMKLVGRSDSLAPQYEDVFATATWAINARHHVAAHVLWADDNLQYKENDGTLSSSYGSRYGWLSWDADWTPSLTSRTIVSTGALDWNRRGDAQIIQAFRSTVNDRRDFAFNGVRQDWLWSPSGAFALKWGAELRSMQASYDYAALKAHHEVHGDTLVNAAVPVSVALTADGDQRGIYLAPRIRPWPWLVAEVGARYDETWWSGTGSVSPRANVLVTLGPKTTLRLAAGRYVQPQQIFGLQVQDSVTKFGAPDVAEHRTIGLEHRFGLIAIAKLEVYERRLTQERPRYINLRSDVHVFPELELDRAYLPATSGCATGVEASVHGLAVGGFDWALSYTNASVTDRVGAVDVPRTWDQQHTIYVDASYHPPDASWRVTVAWQAHSGWPESPVQFVVDTLLNSFGQRTLAILTHYGPVTALGSARLPWYHRIDARFTKQVTTSRGRMSFFVDMFNILDATNPAAYDYRTAFGNGGITVAKVAVPQIGFLPSAGISWEF